MDTGDGGAGRQAAQHSVARRSVGAPEGQLPRWLMTYGRVVGSRLMSAGLLQSEEV